MLNGPTENSAASQGKREFKIKIIIYKSLNPLFQMRI